MVMRQFLYPVFLLSGIFSAAAAPFPEDPFPEYKTIPRQLRMPKCAVIRTDVNGDTLVNGQKRYLVGVSCSATNLDVNLRPTAGYSPSLKWLYEGVLTFETAQRLGFDTITTNVPATWLKTINPKLYVEGINAKNLALARRMLGNGLPFAVDFTLFPWSHGRLHSKRPAAPKIGQDAYNNFLQGNNNHWVPYNIFHPQGVDLYRRMWRDGTREMKRLISGPILHYELFNEPAYNDPGPYNKRRFEEHLQRKFQTVETMNRTFRSRFRTFQEAASLTDLGKYPALSVEWGKFLEEGFTKLTRIGRAAVREADPEAKVCTQVIGMNYYRTLPMSNINIFEINRSMDAIALPTSGGLTYPTTFEKPPRKTVEAPANSDRFSEGILCRHLFRAMADGKPIHNPEAYARKSRKDNRNLLWMDLLRGSNQTYLFAWGRMLTTWKPDFTEEGGRRQAEKYPYVMTNPYSFSTDALAGIAEGRAEILKLADFFVSRKQFESVRPREVAVMLSYPTERYGVQIGYGRKNEILNYTSALEFSHYPMDALFEEQLSENRHTRYKAIVAPGVLCTGDGTLERLEQYVRNGGILLAARSEMPFDEYGNPRRNTLFQGLHVRERKQKTLSGSLQLKLPIPDLLPGTIRARNDLSLDVDPATWEILGTLRGEAAVLRRKLGKGSVYFIAPMMQDYAIAAVTGAILQFHGIHPLFRIRRLPEKDLAVNIELHASRAGRITAAFLYNHDLYPKRMEIALPENCSTAVDVFRQEILPVRNGYAEFFMPSNDRILLGFGSPEDLKKRFGTLRPITGNEISLRFSQAEKEHEDRLRKAESSQFAYSADRANLIPLNLRPFANRSFQDQRPNDGKGGWTDQGKETSLDGVPWGVHTFAGIPCDLIRFDENSDRSCIMLQSRSLKEKLPAEIRGIPVNRKVSKIYFFHTTAWSRPKGTVSMIYRLRYADGGVREIPIRNGIDVYDWWSVKRPENESCRVAWKNLNGRGFTVMEWVHPEADREIASIDIRSTNTATIPIVLAITVEQNSGNRKQHFFDSGTAAGWGGVSVRPLDRSSFALTIGNQTKSWAGARISGSPLLLPEKERRNATLRFLLKVGSDKFGNPRQKMESSLKLELFSDRLVRSSSFKISPVSRQREFIFPLRDLKSCPERIKTLSFQYLGPADAGFEIKNLRIEY